MNVVEPIRSLDRVLDIGDYLREKNERDYVLFLSEEIFSPKAKTTPLFDTPVFPAFLRNCYVKTFVTVKKFR